MIWVKQQNNVGGNFSSMDFIWLLMLCISVAPFSLCPRALYVFFYILRHKHHPVQWNCVYFLFILTLYLYLLFFALCLSWTPFFAFALSGKCSIKVVVGVASQLLYYALDLLWWEHANVYYMYVLPAFIFFSDLKRSSSAENKWHQCWKLKTQKGRQQIREHSIWRDTIWFGGYITISVAKE